MAQPGFRRRPIQAAEWIRISPKITSRNHNATRQADRAELAEAGTAWHSDLDFLRPSFDKRSTNGKIFSVAKREIIIDQILNAEF